MIKIKKNETKNFDLISRDGRKKWYLTLDTETTQIDYKNVVYDVGLAIHDIKGRIIYKRQFILSEIFDNYEIMKSAYYASKIPMYMDKLREEIRKEKQNRNYRKKIEKVTVKQFLNFFIKIVAEYDVDYICAYNLSFDLEALKNTFITYLPESFKNWRNVKTTTFITDCILKNPKIEFICIYNYACETIMTRKGIQGLALLYYGTNGDYDFISEAGNIRTSAERVYSLLTGVPVFEEEHTSLADVLIEIAILKFCKKMGKYSFNIDKQCWKIPQNNFKKLVKEKQEKGILKENTNDIVYNVLKTF